MSSRQNRSRYRPSVKKNYWQVRIIDQSCLTREWGDFPFTNIHEAFGDPSSHPDLMKWHGSPVGCLGVLFEQRKA